MGREVEEKVKVTNKLNAEIDTIKSEISKKETQISKIEKEKREISIAQDKSKKKINELESEKTISDKEAEICDLKQLSDIKERQLKCDIEREVEEKVKVTNKLNAEIDTIKSEISKKRNSDFQN